ncbi:tetratricopeptide repeat protein [Candidatus Sumerlaeota bacterium]|nr:tetratricopeptide repeat protein [Candidatus Sumerlaeota bacterium]
MNKREKKGEIAPGAPNKSKSLKGWRRWGFPLICLLFIPFFIFLVFEICLRILDFGYPAAFYNKSKFDGKIFFTENKKFGWRFFPRSIARSPLEQIISPHKKEKHFRIVILGESAAMGDPDPSFGFARILEFILNSRFPDHRFEVINAAMTGINSYMIREIARDAAILKPDFFIVYAGNNEVVGPFGSGTVFSPFSRSLSLIRLKLWIEKNRIGQLLHSCRFALSKEVERPSVWGMNLFLKHKIRHDDKKLQITYRHFSKNLADVCNAGKKARAKTILCPVATNLASCPPFASLHSEQISESRKIEWNRLYESGVEMENQKSCEEAIRFYRQALLLDDSFADLHFRMGTCLVETGKPEEARHHFLLARDYDCLRFRADSRIDNAIRETALKKGAILADVSGEIDRLSKNNIPGDDSFLDHVHLNFSGNYRIASFLAKIIERQIPVSPSGEIPDESACAANLAYTTFDQGRILKLMLERMSVPPFTNQMNHSDRMDEKRICMRELKIYKDSPALRNSLLAYRYALEKQPDDWMLHENFAHLLQNTDLAPEEADAWRNVIRLLPHHPERWASLGQALARAGNFQEAIHACETALSHDPHNAAAHNGLGMAYAGLNDSGKAKAHYVEALRLKPDYLDARHNLGVLFSSSGDPHQAMDHFIDILAKNPDDADSHFNLAMEWAKKKDYQNAERHFLEVLRINPFHVEALYNLGFISTERGDPEKAEEFYSKALELDPDYANAHNNLGALYARMGMFPKAIHHFSEVLRIKPEDAEIRYNLGLAFSGNGQPEKAVSHFEKLIQSSPHHSRAHYQLGLNLEGMGKIQEAQDHYRKALALNPDWAEVKNQLAWALSVSPDSQTRNPEESLRLALQACQRTDFKIPSYLDTLAAAYASSGRFSEAVDTAQKALDLALALDQVSLAGDIEKRLELYKKRLPFFDSMTQMRDAPFSKSREMIK